MGVLGDAHRCRVAVECGDFDRNQVRLAGEICQKGIGGGQLKIAGGMDHGQSKVLPDLVQFLAHFMATFRVKGQQRLNTGRKPVQIQSESRALSA